MSKYIDAEKLKEKLVEESVWAALKVVEIVDKMIEERKTEPTISKMEQVDKDINVRSKDEPQTDTNCHYDSLRDYEYDKAIDQMTDCAWNKGE